MYGRQPGGSPPLRRPHLAAAPGVAGDVERRRAPHRRPAAPAERRRGHDGVARQVAEVLPHPLRDALGVACGREGQFHTPRLADLARTAPGIGTPVFGASGWSRLGVDEPRGERASTLTSFGVGELRRRRASMRSLSCGAVARGLAACGPDVPSHAGVGDRPQTTPPPHHDHPGLHPEERRRPRCSGASVTSVLVGAVQPWPEVVISPCRSGLSGTTSLATKAVSMSATMMSPTSSLTLVKMPRLVMLAAAPWLSSVGVR